MLLIFLEYLDASSLRMLGSACKFLYAACHSDDLWKSLYLESELKNSTALEWRGTWRSTFLRLPEEPNGAINCDTVFSDVLHRPFVCSNIDLATYTASIPACNQIARFETISNDDFAGQWARKPFILTKCIQDWPAFRDWNLEYFSTKYRDVVFRAESVDWTFETYTKYMTTTSDESPVYLFDRKFAEKMDISVGQEAGATYWRPECFGPDLFELLGAERPAHRWLIIGPQRSGSTFHKDPNATSAWNAVIQGAKYWIMFPPGADVPGVYVSSDSSEVTSPLSIAEWLLEFHAEARQSPGCIEGICEMGEILHVPSGWWHLVVNLEPGIALTQNFVPVSSDLYHLSEAIAFLKDKADQVTGFKRDVTDPYQLFTNRLREKHPDLLERALGILDAKKEQKKRKWDTAVGGDSQDSGVGFSFGFGGDDEDIP
ncbi:related to phosphatidylserine-specific receptor [Cephalotrichum gorgonifer]|uniref:Related to phosphatidylserine-specific receptor n=1 Tax=Cephalotrichum gorgonifer TaxID=2041049 RepID=A0AAE8SQX8_9PEZI|nr:related to phosphatidylserine-specific receptor [Cephalotrichum gorgonifer]